MLRFPDAFSILNYKKLKKVTGQIMVEIYIVHIEQLSLALNWEMNSLDKLHPLLKSQRSH